MTAIRNRHTHRLLLRDGRGRARVAIPGRRLSRAHWTLEEVDGGYVRLVGADEPDVRLTLKKGAPVCGQASDEATRAMWRPVDAGDGFVRLQSRRHPEQYLHTESGTLEVGPVKDAWWSALWSLDEKFSPDARSVHLLYEFDDSSAFTVTSRVKRSSHGTYVMSVGFDGGYFGMQELSSGRGKQLIFSVWDQATNQKREEVLAEHRASVVELGEGVQRRDFGDEGTGEQTTRPYDWDEGQPVGFLVTAEAAGDATHFSAYVRTRSEWEFFATLARPHTGGRLLTGLYSFVEDFVRNGATDKVRGRDRTPYQHRVAEYSEIWACSADGEWSPVRDAEFSAWGQDPPRLTNINASVVDDTIAFRLETGGPVVQDTELKQTLHADGEPSEAPSLPKAAGRT